MLRAQSVANMTYRSYLLTFVVDSIEFAQRRTSFFVLIFSSEKITVMAWKAPAGVGASPHIY